MLNKNLNKKGVEQNDTTRNYTADWSMTTKAMMYRFLVDGY